LKTLDDSGPFLPALVSVRCSVPGSCCCCCCCHCREKARLDRSASHGVLTSLGALLKRYFLDDDADTAGGASPAPSSVVAKDVRGVECGDLLLKLRALPDLVELMVETVIVLSR
jgi:hypothetical protein